MKTRRTEIMKTAYDLMGLEGLEAVHARTVAAELGINHATVHYYFPKRLDLLVGIAEHAMIQFRSDRQRFYDGLESSGDKLEGELALAEAYSKKQSRFTKVLAGLYVAAIAEPELKKHLQGLWKEWSTTISDLVDNTKVKSKSPYNDGELLAATLFGFTLTSHLTNQKFDASGKIDAVFSNMFE